MASDWNIYLERKLALDLTLEEGRLLDAIAYGTLGWGCRRRGIGQLLLRNDARLHGRSFERARRGLVRHGIIALDRGSPGRGSRDTYELLLEPEKPALERALHDGKSPPASGQFDKPEMPAEMPATMPALERARKEQRPKECSLPTVENTLGAAADAAGSERATSEHRELLQALVRTLGVPDDWGEYAAAASGLLEQHVRPDELPAIVQAHRARFPDADVTASSIDKWAAVLRDKAPA